MSITMHRRGVIAASIMKMVAGDVDPHFSMVVAGMHFDEENPSAYTDVTGRVPAVINVAASTDIDDIYGRAGHFTGSSYIAYPVSPSFNLNPAEKPFSIAIRFKITANAEVGGDGLRRACLYSWTASNSTTLFSILIDGTSSTTGTGITLEYRISGTDHNFTITHNLNDGDYHWLTICGDTSGIYMGIDGTVVANPAITQSSSGLGINNTAIWGRGVDVATWRRFFVGEITEARIWNGVAKWKSNYTLTGPFPDI